MNCTGAAALGEVGVLHWERGGRHQNKKECCEPCAEIFVSSVVKFMEIICLAIT